MRSCCGTRLLVGLAVCLPFLGCGGGGGGGGDGSSPPLSLVYLDGAPVYRTETAIVPNTAGTTGGTPELFEIAPALPVGLALDPLTGTISGTPTAPAAATQYTVTASNADGATQALLDLEVKWIHHKSIAPHAPLSDDDIRHLLARTHLGFHQSAYESILQDGLASYLSDALDAVEPGATDALEAEADAFVRDKAFPSQAELALWWLHCIQRNENPLQEVLALHWHDHFACSSDVLVQTNLYWYFDHINLWRHNGAGNLRDLIIAMARDWSMLEYLDGRDSTKAIPNENFGREFLELFCNGVNNGYDQADIVAAAALFSGYRRYFDGTKLFIQWTPTQHNADDQTYLGVFFPGVANPPQDLYPQVVDATLAHRPAGDPVGYTSRWIVTSLLRRFALEAPPTELVDQLAAVLESNGWALKPLLLALFQSEAFFSPEARTGFIKTPVEHIVGFIRTTNLPVPIGRDGNPGLDALLTQMGNRPTQPPVVAGWPEGEGWLSAQGMVDRANSLDYVVISRSFQAGEGVDPADLLPPGLPTAEEVVAALALRMHVPLTVDETLTLVDYLNKDDTGSLTLDPFDPSDPVHIDERIRGLLYVLGQHPKYLLR